MTHNTREDEWKETLDVVIKRYEDCEDDTATFLRKLKNISKSLHHQLQKAREEERERIISLAGGEPYLYVPNITEANTEVK